MLWLCVVQITIFSLQIKGRSHLKRCFANCLNDFQFLDNQILANFTSVEKFSIFTLLCIFIFCNKKRKYVKKLKILMAHHTIFLLNISLINRSFSWFERKTNAREFIFSVRLASLSFMYELMWLPRGLNNPSKWNCSHSS